LYLNYLPNVPGKYIARTDNEADLTIEQVCAALKNRGGFTGNYEDLVEFVKRFFDEVAYQLCNGFAVNVGYFSVHPNIGGTFDKLTEGQDEEKHPVTFRFRVRAPLRALAQHIVVVVEGLADAGGYIDEIIDVATESVDENLTPGGMINISGHKIKVAGDNADIGIYFVSATDPTQRVKVISNLAENASSKIIALIPALASGGWKLEIITQYSSGSFFLKEPRTITFASELTVV
jgi:hypothetical protein